MVAGADSAFAMPSAREKVIPGLVVRKPTSCTAVKKLPWLDGKSPRSVASTPTKRSSSDAVSPSPTTRPSSRKSSAAVAPARGIAPTPTIRRKSQVVPTVASVASSSPSPVARHRLSQARRPTITSKESSPLKAQPSNRTSVSHEPQKRLSIVRHHQRRKRILAVIVHALVVLRQFQIISRYRSRLIQCSRDRLGPALPQ
jgi:hypothetical protein